MLTRVLALATVLLTALVVYQLRTIGELRTTAAAATRRAADTRGAMMQAVADRSLDVQRAVAWLDDFYKAQDGLQRPGGLCGEGRPDYVGIGAWIFDVYLRHRLQGDTDEQSRDAVVNGIKQSPEWRGKHPS
jgi:hypothetical protein